MNEKNNFSPIIFIIGTTCVGKTKLSLKLSEQLKNSEIISCDSMQLYKSADILTAKATKSEQNIVKHHLIDVLNITDIDFNKNIFQEISFELINSLLINEKIPLIVGGTHYYIECLLFKNMETNFFEEKKETLIENIDYHDYNLLKKIDPIMANKLHPSDIRRIENALKLYQKEKILPSEMLKLNEEKKDLTFINTIILWPYMTDIELLNQRMIKRIDDMIDLNGIKEVIHIYESFCKDINNINEIDDKINFTKGIMQSIGYKEFFEFYKYWKNYSLMNSINVYDIKDLDKDEKILKIIDNCKKELIKSTIKYAKKQIKWIKNRLCNISCLKNHFYIFPFENFEESNYEEKVLIPAIKLIDLFQKTNDLTLINNEFEKFDAFKYFDSINQKIKISDWKKYNCEICEKDYNGQNEWDSHLKSKLHKSKKKNIEKKKKINNLIKN